MRRTLLLLAVSALLPLPALAETTVTITVTAAPSRGLASFGAVTTASAAAPAAHHGGPEGGGNQIDSAAGAAGPDGGSGGISKGGVVAIGVMCGLAVIVIIPLTVLFVLAKRRGWQVRQSLRRVSRRFTGRLEAAQARRRSRHNGGVRVASPARGRQRAGGGEAPARAKAGARVDARAAANARDVEKGGTGDGPKPLEKVASSATVTSAFEVETPVVKSWRAKMAGLGFGRR